MSVIRRLIRLTYLAGQAALKRKTYPLIDTEDFELALWAYTHEPTTSDDAVQPVIAASEPAALQWIVMHGEYVRSPGTTPLIPTPKTVGEEHIHLLETLIGLVMRGEVTPEPVVDVICRVLAVDEALDPLVPFLASYTARSCFTATEIVLARDLQVAKAWLSNPNLPSLDMHLHTLLPALVSVAVQVEIGDEIKRVATDILKRLSDSKREVRTEIQKLLHGIERDKAFVLSHHPVEPTWKASVLRKGSVCQALREAFTEEL